MRFHPERYIGFAFLLLVLSLVVPTVVDSWRISHLPPVHATVKDRWRVSHLPAPVRATVEERSAGSKASWVKESVEGGAWIYDLHILRDRKWSVIRITPNGNVIQTEPDGVVEAGD